MGSSSHRWDLNSAVLTRVLTSKLAAASGATLRASSLTPSLHSAGPPPAAAQPPIPPAPAPRPLLTRSANTRLPPVCCSASGTRLSAPTQPSGLAPPTATPRPRTARRPAARPPGLGRKYQSDRPHAQHVADLSRQLFDQLTDDHQLDPRFSILLHTAALLHEIGGFVSSRSLHKHSMYLIQQSDLFGLTRTDMLLVALVARYHRGATPKPTHLGYSKLDRDQRIAVTKLAALLRVATGLDASRSGHISEFTCQRNDGKLVIAIPGVDDLSIEQLALDRNGLLFQPLFGMSVLLRQAEQDGPNH